MEKNIEKLTNLVNNTKIDVENEVKIEEWKDLKGPNNGKTLYSKSPYYQHFNNILVQQSTKEENIGNKKNPLYCKDFIQSLTKKYMPCIVIWSKMGNGELSNNTYVENHFKNVKALYLDEEKNLKITRFIKKMLYAINLLLNSVKFSDLFKKKNMKRKRGDLDIDDLNQCEKWNKRKRSVTPTFPGNYIKSGHIISTINTSTPKINYLDRATQRSNIRN